jgi:hypothetical protein
MQLTAEDAAVGAAYFDPAVRNRTAKIVDFFLKYLTVPAERKRLRVKDPEKYNWHPKRLITELAQIHLALYRVRRAEWVQVRLGAAVQPGARGCALCWGRVGSCTERFQWRTVALPIQHNRTQIRLFAACR